MSTEAALKGLVRHAIATTPRSLQKALGPSEMGHPCARRVAYRLAGTPASNERHGWRPTVGTAVHAWLAEQLDTANRADVHGAGRWMTEHRVHVGNDVTGSADLYDRDTATVVDFKVVGVASLRDKRTNGPGEQYRTQVHLYGHGFLARGLPVEKVAIWFLPMSGELEEAHWWSEPYNQTVVDTALARHEALEALLKAGGTPALVPTTPTYCTYCPWHRHGSTDPSQACDGQPQGGTP